MAIMVWAAFFLQSKELMIFAFLIFLSSAILKTKRAPLIFFHTNTIGKVLKPKTEVVNESALAFAHKMATGFSLICLVFLYFINEQVGWGIVLVFAIMKTISASGYCPGTKLYECANNDTCCAFAKKALKKNAR
jgi:hypothetical protein